MILEHFDKNSIYLVPILGHAYKAIALCLPILSEGDE